MDILLVKGNHNIKLDLHQAKAITDILLNHFSRIYFQEPWPLVGGGDNPLFAGYQYTMYFVWSHYIKWAIFLSIKGFLVLECTSFDLCQWFFKVFIFLFRVHVLWPLTFDLVSSKSIRLIFPLGEEQCTRTVQAISKQLWVEIYIIFLCPEKPDSWTLELKRCDIRIQRVICILGGTSVNNYL